MAEKIRRSVQFNGEFDVQAIINDINRIKEELNTSGAKDTFVRQYSNQLDQILKKAGNLGVILRSGFSSDADVTNAQKAFTDLSLTIERVSNELKTVKLNGKDINISGNAAKQLNDIYGRIKQINDMFKGNRQLFSVDISGLATGLDLSKSFVNELSGMYQNQEAFNKALQNQESSYQKNVSEAKDQQKALQDRLTLHEKTLASLKEQNKETERMRDIYSKINSLMSGKGNLRDMRADPASDFNNLVNQLSSQDQVAISGLTSKSGIIEYLTKVSNSIKSISTRSAQTEVDSLTLKFQRQSEIVDQVEQELKDYQRFMQNASGLQLKFESDESAFKQELADLKAYEKEIMESEIADAQREIVRSGEDLLDVRQKNTSTVQSGIDAVREENSALAEQERTFANLTARVREYFGFYQMWNLVTRGIKDAYNELKDLDKAFTEIAVVTDMTTSQLWDSFDAYNQMAQQLGVTTKDAVQTSALYYQQGLDTAEVMELTTETIKMARIAGLDFATTTEYMTAAIRGLKLEMSDANRVNDVFSSLAAVSATDTEDLAIALSKTASLAKSVGFELETVTAFLAQGIESTQEAPETIGTALKSISARFAELKRNPLEISIEVDGEEVFANRVEAALSAAGVALRDASGQFRDLDDVFLELSKSWESLDRMTQRYISTEAAGSRQRIFDFVA